LPYLYLEANVTLMPPLIATGAVKKNWPADDNHYS
jgi:hypothetical protein